MKEEILDMHSLEEKVIEEVKKAGELIKNADFKVSSKGDCANIVTDSDLKVQRYLYEKLKELVQDSGFYGEEDEFKDIEREYVWIIDPIDGTTNYSRGIPECAISVALVKNGRVVLGVVYDIFKNEVFSAVAGDGAYHNGNRINVSQRSFENGLFCTAMSLYKKEYALVCNDIIYEAYMQCNDVRRFGSCALELCYLAAGRCELYFEIRVFPWDYAAAYLILTEAGGVLRGFGGKAPDLTKPTALIGANNLENYEKLNKIVLKHLEKLPYEE